MVRTSVGIVPTICVLRVRTKGFILAALPRNTFSSVCLLLNGVTQVYYTDLEGWMI